MTRRFIQGEILIMSGPDILLLLFNAIHTTAFVFRLFKEWAIIVFALPPSGSSSSRAAQVRPADLPDSLHPQGSMSVCLVFIS